MANEAESFSMRSVSGTQWPVNQRALVMRSVSGTQQPVNQRALV